MALWMTALLAFNTEGDMKWASSGTFDSKEHEETVPEEVKVPIYYEESSYALTEQWT